MQIEGKASPEQLLALEKRIAQCARPLPGRGPYENRRPIHVPQRFCGERVEAFLTKRFAHVDPKRWRAALSKGQILWEGKRPASPEERVFGGTTLLHCIPDSCEPAVDPAILPIYEDDALLVLSKPAPLPMHPCGRFRRNTLIYLLELAMPEQPLKIVHRLDADTSGVVVLAKSRAAARALVEQFEAREVKKVYRARVWGRMAPGHRWSREDPIGSQSQEAGTRRVCSDGRSCRTDFLCLQSEPDGQSLLAAFPQEGRTHQIRIHAAQSGYPILNDPAYGKRPDLQAGLAQGLRAPLRLHAAELSLRHPVDGSPQCWKAPLPAWARNRASCEAD